MSRCFKNNSNMTAKWFLCSCLLFVLTWEIKCQDPPIVRGSYMATGEMVETLEDESALLTQMSFEESHDAVTQNAAFRIWVLGKSVTFIENFKTNQTFRHNETDCTLETIQEWVRTKSPPSLLAYEDTNGTVRFSLKQLFSLDNKYLKEKNQPAAFRGIQAKKWMYEIRGKEQDTGSNRILSIYAYWSDKSWITTSSDDMVPLGFVVTKLTYRKGTPGVKLHEQFINVYSFVPDTINRKLFEPVQGVMCENRTQTLEFPDVKNMKAIALRSELIFPENLEIRYIDFWLDSRNKLLRIDMERIKDDVPISVEKKRNFQSIVVIGPMGVVFKGEYHRSLLKCSVIPSESFEFDVQNLFNFKLPVAKWEVSKLFGRNETTYVYIGKTFKRDIPCHMFQGIRKDWPEPSANVTSLWEWCFSVNMTKKDDIILFRNGEFGLINAQIKVLESGDPGFFYPGLKMIHHFYDVGSKDPAIMSATDFDITGCFEENEKRDLQFEVDWVVSDDNIHLIENATSDANFLQKWKNMIYQWTGLPPYTLRVAKVKSVVEDKKLFVKFLLLAPHSALPKDIKELQKSSFDAEVSFRNSINAGKVFVSYLPSKKSTMLKLFVAQHSLKFQINREFQPHTLPPPTSSESTSPRKFTFNLITEPVKESTSVSNLPITNDPTKVTDSSPSETVPTSVSNLPITNDPTKVTDSSPSETVPTSVSNEPTTNNPTKEQSRSTTPATEKQPNGQYTGYAPGAVASVSVAMLLVGVSVGSAGIFIKYNGFPSC